MYITTTYLNSIWSLGRLASNRIPDLEMHGKSLNAVGTSRALGAGRKSGTDLRKWLFHLHCGRAVFNDKMAF